MRLWSNRTLSNILYTEFKREDCWRTRDVTRTGRPCSSQSQSRQGPRDWLHQFALPPNRQVGRPDDSAFQALAGTADLAAQGLGRQRVAPLADLANSHTSNHVATTAHEVGGNASGDQDRFLSAWHKRFVHACKHINSNRGRLVASIGLLLVPIAVLGFLFVAQSYKSIGFAERELKGVAYARAVSSVLADLAGRHTEPSPHLQNFNEARTRFDHDLATSAASTALISALDASSTNPDGALDAARSLLIRIGDQSNLVLDPDLDSYYVMEVFLRRLPNLIVTSRKVSDELLRARVADAGSPERTIEMLMGIGQLAAGVRALGQSVEAAITQNSDGLLHGRVAEPASRLTGKLQDLVRGARIDITINGLADPSAFDRPQIESMAAETNGEARSLSNITANELERLLRARISRLTATLTWGLSISVLLAIVAILVAHNVLRSMVVRLDDQIIFLAHHDAMTGLANRVLLNEKLEKALLRTKRGSQLLAVHMLDLDQFKNVNDTLGHPAGDALLTLVAGRLLDVCRDTDTVARMGGDEFALIQERVSQPSDAAALALRIIDAVSKPYDIENQQVVIGTSVGIAIGPGDGLSADGLLRNADLALYRAKADGRRTFRFFEQGMDANMRERRAMESDLRKALADGELELHYQPVVNLASGEITGFEALMRWRHPEKGLVAPSNFIPVAEEIGLIVPLGRGHQAGLRRRCDLARRLGVAVNLSPVQFCTPGLVQVVAGALATCGLPAERLELEITESTLLQNCESTLSTLYQLRALGVRIAMDDFGTGYSSLSYLRSFPFDKIKIDGPSSRTSPTGWARSVLCVPWRRWRRASA